MWSLRSRFAFLAFCTRLTGIAFIAFCTLFAIPNCFRCASCFIGNGNLYACFFFTCLFINDDGFFKCHSRRIAICTGITFFALWSLRSGIALVAFCTRLTGIAFIAFCTLFAIPNCFRCASCFIGNGNLYACFFFTCLFINDDGFFKCHSRRIAICTGITFFALWSLRSGIALVAFCTRLTGIAFLAFLALWSLKPGITLVTFCTRLSGIAFIAFCSRCSGLARVAFIALFALRSWLTIGNEAHMFAFGICDNQIDTTFYLFDFNGNTANREKRYSCMYYLRSVLDFEINIAH